MKKVYVIIFLLFVTAMCYSQQYTNNDFNQVNNIKFGLFNDCTGEWLAPPTRKGMQDAYEDLNLYKRNHPSDNCMKIKADGSARIDISNKWNEGGTTLPHVPVETENDTLVYGWSKVRLNRLKQIVFTYRTKLGGQDYETVHLKVRDTTIFRKCPQTDFCERDSMQFNIKRFYIDGQLKKIAEEIEKPIDTTVKIFSYIRSSDITGMSVQTYAPFDWIYNYKTADTYDAVTDKCTDWQPQWNRWPAYQAGNPQNETHEGVVYPSLWRHSTNKDKANKKCFKVGVENKVTGIIYDGPFHVNPNL